MVGEQNIGVPLLEVMDGASDNHLASGHVTFRQATSTIFLVVDTSQKGRLSFASFFRAARACKLPYMNFFLHQKKVSF